MRSAILAGGTASRFDGTPKGLELIGGDRILDRLIQSLRTATGEIPHLIANAPDAAEWRPDLEVVEAQVEQDVIQLAGHAPVP